MIASEPLERDDVCIHFHSAGIYNVSYPYERAYDFWAYGAYSIFDHTVRTRTKPSYELSSAF